MSIAAPGVILPHVEPDFAQRPDEGAGTWLYPPIEPYRTGRLQVSSVHELYFEESGNPSGKPVSSCTAVRRRLRP